MKRENKGVRHEGSALLENLSKRLAAYASVATAASVGALALAAPAEASIISSPENITINSTHTPETLTIVGSRALNFTFSAIPAVQSLIHLSLKTGVIAETVPLAKGAKIGPSGSFLSSGGTAVMAGFINTFRGKHFAVARESRLSWLRVYVRREKPLWLGENDLQPQRPVCKAHGIRL